MAHFAMIDDNDVVIKVVVIEQDVIDSGLFGDPSKFIQTSFNTRGGVHYDPDTGKPSKTQGKALRKNFAGIGDKYDRKLDAFIKPKEYESWVLNEQTCLWEPSIPKPTDGHYEWSEPKKIWVKIDA